MPLKHIQQVDNQTCTSACLAMMLNEPIMTIISEFHMDWVNVKTDPVRYLKSKGVDVTPLTPFTKILGDGMYLTAVPSLNEEGTLHHVVVTFKDSEMKIFDPNQGRDGKKYYVNNLQQKKNELEVYFTHHIYELKLELPEELNDDEC